MPEPIEIYRRLIEVDGGRLSIFRFGPLVEKPVVVAVHGITGNSHAWTPVARALGDRVAMVAPDLRGRGRSNNLPAPYGIDVHVRDVLAVLDALGLDRAVLVGHSLGAYIVAQLGVSHPDRVQALVLVDGGLPIPGSQGVEPQAFADAFLGPAMARLKLCFPDRDAYRDWWRSHRALSGSDVADEDVVAYADHDLVGAEPEMRSSVREEAVRADISDLPSAQEAAYGLTVSAQLLCAPRGLLDDPNPMQPLELAQTWALQDPAHRQAVLIPRVNHYTITLGAAGAAAVAGAIAASADGSWTEGEG